MKYIWILAACVVPFLALAQPSAPQGAESESTHASKVLVVPFHQTRYYFSDCDKHIAAESKLELPEVSSNFRFGLDYAAEARLEKAFAPVNLAQLRDSLGEEYMDAFYKSVTYSYETPARLAAKPAKGFLGRAKDAFSQIGQKKEEAAPEEAEVEAYTRVEALDQQYMALNWKENGFLDALQDTYDAEYIVTINQFEIKTDYERCIDRDLGNYTRRIKVHYNVFDATGQRIAGDVITATYNSTTDDIHRIIQDNFGMLADYIMHSLPRS